MTISKKPRRPRDVAEQFRELQQLRNEVRKAEMNLLREENFHPKKKATAVRPQREPNDQS